MGINFAALRIGSKILLVIMIFYNNNIVLPIIDIICGIAFYRQNLNISYRCL